MHRYARSSVIYMHRFGRAPAIGWAEILERLCTERLGTEYPSRAILYIGSVDESYFYDMGKSWDAHFSTVVF